jgi:glutaredoxin
VPDGGRQNGLNDGRSTRVADQRVTVELYTLSTCPWSRNARAWLDNRHVTYDFVDYDLAGEDMQTHIQEEMVSRGASAFPFVKFGDTDFIIGFNPDAFARLLGLPKDAELEAEALAKADAEAGAGERREAHGESGEEG